MQEVGATQRRLHVLRRQLHRQQGTTDARKREKVTTVTSLRLNLSPPGACDRTVTDPKSGCNQRLQVRGAGARKGWSSVRSARLRGGRRGVLIERDVGFLRVHVSCRVEGLWQKTWIHVVRSRVLFVIAHLVRKAVQGLSVVVCITLGADESLFQIGRLGRKVV